MQSCALRYVSDAKVTLPIVRLCGKRIARFAFIRCMRENGTCIYVSRNRIERARDHSSVTRRAFHALRGELYLVCLSHRYT